MAVYEVEIDGKIYEVDDSSLGQYINPQTGELQIDVVAEDLRKGLSEEQKAALQSADETLKELNEQFPRKSPLWAGGVRTFTSGAVPFAEEAEAGVRSVFTDTPYEEYLNRARESKERFSANYPIGSLAAGAAGGLASFLVPGSPMAKGAQWAAKGANFGSKLGRTVALEGGIGTLWGFGEGEGGFGNRLSNAGWGLGLGLVGGTVAPSASLLGGGLSRSLKNLKSGIVDTVTPQQVDDFVLRNVLTEEGTETADVLRRAAGQGAKDIQKPLTSLNTIWKTAHNKAAGLRDPRAYKTPSMGGTTVAKIYDVEPTSYIKAKADFADFVGKNTSTQPDVGWKAGASFQKRNPSAAKILEKTKGLSDLDPDSFDWWQKAEQTLSARLPKKIPDATKLTGETKKIYDAVNDISHVREQLFPGTQKLNERYLAAKADVASQPSTTSKKLGTLDVKQTPYRVEGGIIPTVANALYRPIDRGIARRAIQSGTLPNKQIPSSLYQGTNTATDAIIKAILGW